MASVSVVAIRGSLILRRGARSRAISRPAEGGGRRGRRPHRSHRAELRDEDGLSFLKGESGADRQRARSRWSPMSLPPGRHTSRRALRGTCYAQPMLGLFHLFGRSPELKALDHALREAGLHPRGVPEAVKLTAVRLLKEEAIADARSRDAGYDDAAQLLGYCMLGRDQFIASNSLRTADRVEHRVEAAIAAGDSLDAKLVLLALHSGVIASEIADRFDVETD